MRILGTRAIVLIASLSMTAPLWVACSDEGPLEKVGREADEAWDELTHPNESEFEKAGRKVGEAIDETKKKIKKSLD